MPKVFSKHEREFIRERLKEEAKICLQQYGVKKTTVNELVKKVKIPKGTFYLFYETKEALLFDALLEFHDEIENQLINDLNNVTNKRDVEQITQVIYSMYQKTNNSGLIRLMSTGELELIYRKLPPYVYQEHLKEDANFISEIFKTLELSNQIDFSKYAKTFQDLFVLMIANHKLESDNTSLYLCLKGLVIQMIAESEEVV